MDRRHVDPTSPTRCVLQPIGSLDRVSGARLQQEIEARVEQGASTVVLDCRHVTHLDNAGLRTLLECEKTLQQVGGQFCLSHLDESLQGLLLLTGMDAVFTVL